MRIADGSINVASVAAAVAFIAADVAPPSSGPVRAPGRDRSAGSHFTELYGLVDVGDPHGPGKVEQIGDVGRDRAR